MIDISLFQVSVAAATHKELAKGRASIKLYDDDSYSNLRKVTDFNHEMSEDERRELF